MQAAAIDELQAPAGGTAEPPRYAMLRTILRKKVACVAMVIIFIFYFCGIFAPVIAPYGPDEQPGGLTTETRSAGPSSEHWLGTDGLGRDLMTRIFYAARTTVLFTLVVTLTGSLLLGLGLGLLAGYRGGWVDTAVMRVGEVLGGIPTFIIIVSIATAFRQRILDSAFDLADATPLSVDESRAILQFSILALATLPFSWLGSARIVRSQVLTLRERAFVEAAEAVGASTWRVIWRHLLPGVMPLFWVGISASMGGIALAEIGLSFIGLGIDPPASSFGTLISDGAGVRAFDLHPHLLLAPAIPVVLFVVAWNLLGDALVDILEPKNVQR